MSESTTAKVKKPSLKEQARIAQEATQVAFYDEYKNSRKQVSDYFCIAFMCASAATSVGFAFLKDDLDAKLAFKPVDNVAQIKADSTNLTLKKFQEQAIKSLAPAPIVIAPNYKGNGVYEARDVTAAEKKSSITPEAFNEQVSKDIATDLTVYTCVEALCAMGSLAAILAAAAGMRRVRDDKEWIKEAYAKVMADKEKTVVVETPAIKADAAPAPGSPY